jgi:phosphoribosyl 1,2-cyclic phosphodiesterase
MNIKIYGVRGSIPTPLSNSNIEDKIKKALSLATPGDISSEEAINVFIKKLPHSLIGSYGGNTTCLLVTSDSDEKIIIDAGSGLKPLSRELMKTEFGRGQGFANLLLTHTHWDHIQGIPFFVPFYIKGNRFNIYSPMDHILDRIKYQQVDTHFPVNFDYFASTKNVYQLEPEQDFFLNDMRIINKRMPHPGGAFGYRFEENVNVFVYTSDCEFNIDAIDAIDSYRDFFLNADVAVFDTQYTFEESLNKIDYGHSSASIAIDIAGKFGVKKLVLFHHEPDYSDEKLDAVLSNARIYLDMNKRKVGNLVVEIAYEGMEFIL